MTASGSRLITISSTRAARSGTRRPCSQPGIARASSPKRSATFCRPASCAFAAQHSARRRDRPRSGIPAPSPLAQRGFNLKAAVGVFRRHPVCPYLHNACRQLRHSIAVRRREIPAVSLRVGSHHLYPPDRHARSQSAGCRRTCSSRSRLSRPDDRRDIGRSHDGRFHVAARVFGKKLADGAFTRAGRKRLHREDMLRHCRKTCQRVPSPFVLSWAAVPKTSDSETA